MTDYDKSATVDEYTDTVLCSNVSLPWLSVCSGSGTLPIHDSDRIVASQRRDDRSSS